MVLKQKNAECIILRIKQNTRKLKHKLLKNDFLSFKNKKS